MTENDNYIGECCILGCDEESTCADDLDNLFCSSCAIQNEQEEPDNWIDSDGPLPE